MAATIASRAVSDAVDQVYPLVQDPPVTAPEAMQVVALRAVQFPLAAPVVELMQFCPALVPEIAALIPGATGLDIAANRAPAYVARL